MGNFSSRGKKTNQSVQQAYPNRPQSAPLYPSEPPPPYTPTATPLPPYQAQSMAYGMNNQIPLPAHYPYPSNSPQVMQPVFHGHFDPGARFDATTQPSVPPPPPGVYPNSAQLAVSSGHKVILQQKKNTFLDRKGAGTTFW